MKVNLLYQQGGNYDVVSHSGLHSQSMSILRLEMIFEVIPVVIWLL